MTAKNRKRPDEDVLTWGIIGCGDVVRRKSGPALFQAERSQVRSVMRRDLTRAREFASKHGIPVATDEAEKLIQDSQIDVVYVATPPSSHKSYTIEGAKAGKEVVVEKPMGLNADEAR